MENRKKIQSERKINDKEVISKMSYRIFPEEIKNISKISKHLNNLVKIYCIISRLNVYEIQKVTE